MSFPVLASSPIAYPGRHPPPSHLSHVRTRSVPCAAYSLGAQSSLDIRQCYLPLLPVSVLLAFPHLFSASDWAHEVPGGRSSLHPRCSSADWVLQYHLLTTGRAFRWQLAHSPTPESNLLKAVWTLPLRPARPGTWPRSLAWRLRRVVVVVGLWLQEGNPGSRRVRTRLSVTESRYSRPCPRDIHDISTFLLTHLSYHVSKFSF